MNSGELFTAIAHLIVDGNYGCFTIHSYNLIEVEPEYGITLSIIADGDQIRITFIIKELEGKTGYHEWDVDELKELASEAESAIAPVQILLSRDGCDATLYMRLRSAHCGCREDVSPALDDSIKVMKQAVYTIDNIQEKMKKRKEADLPF